MRSLWLAVALFLLPFFALAATLVNINTADLAALETLPGIGPSKGQAIIDYRTQNGPFGAIEDIQNVSGIGPATYAQIAPLITVGDSVASVSVSDPVATTSSSSGGSALAYVPPPSSIMLDIGADRAAFVNVPLSFSVAVKTKGGIADPSAQVSWSFGDGSSGSGTRVTKTYRYAGTYVVSAIASDGDASARAAVVVTVSAAHLAVAAISADGITLSNDGNARLDISGWHLSAEYGSFRFPDGTVLLPEATVLIPWSITNLPVALAATLSYPDGTIAARYPASAPTAPPESTEKAPAMTASVTVMTPAPAPATTVVAVHAPRAAALAAVAAEVPLTSATTTPARPIDPPVSASAGLGVLHSGWTIGLLGILALAGGAFLIL